MENLTKKGLVRPISQIDEADCTFNWEVFECTHCAGSGGVRDDFPESESYGEIIDCYECDGTGQVAVLKRLAGR